MEKDWRISTGVQEQGMICELKEEYDIKLSPVNALK
jgi:hypothetical protein